MKQIIGDMYKKHIDKKDLVIYELEKGDIIKIGGIPCEYLGEDLIGTGTNLFKVGVIDKSGNIT